MNIQTQVENDIKFIENYFIGSKVVLFNNITSSLSYELFMDFCFDKSNEKDFNRIGLKIVSICPNNSGLKIKIKRDVEN